MNSLYNYPQNYSTKNTAVIYKFYCPLKSVPQMSTASSAHMRMRIIRRAKQMEIRYSILFIFLIIRSHIRPVQSNRAPPTTKSKRFQFTSSVNCMTTNGMSNTISEVSTIMTSLLLCIIIKCSYYSYLTGNLLFPVIIQNFRRFCNCRTKGFYLGGLVKLIFFE